MGIIFLILAIIFLSFGHYFKVYRQMQFIEIYEKPKPKILLNSLVFGYMINFFVPFRLGDLFRAWYSGKRMKNGVSFALSTIIVDRTLDIFFVALMFFIMYLLDSTNNLINYSFYFYIIFSIILIICFVILLRGNKLVKKIINKFAFIFNKYLELKILIFSWCLITAFKDMFEKIKTSRLLINTVVMWFFYILSYNAFALSMQYFGYNFKLTTLLIALFSKSGFDFSALGISKIFISNSIIFFAYLFTPLLLIYIFSIFQKEKSGYTSKYLEVLPQLMIEDKLNFLELYFEGKSSKYIKNYLFLNRDICIIKDYSAGSNATTILCTDNTNIFFRKYSFGNDSIKLFEQAEWLKKYYNIIKLPKVINLKNGNEYCSYDMPYSNDSVSCFSFIHSVPIEQGWKILYKILESLRKNLYILDCQKADDILIKKYIETKVTGNIKKIVNSEYIKPLLAYDELIINGITYKNLPYFKKYFTEDHLRNVFKNDNYTVIHGDLTIENIICNKKDFYIIDPNPSNIHNSDNLDYAKLLQSLHGNYEFYMNTSLVHYVDNTIEYLFTKSVTYDKILKKYKKYLFDKFSQEKVKSIFYHEIIHWFRLMPYKIEKNKERSVLFYAAMIIVINEVIEMFGD